MANLNSVHLMGNLTRDPEVRYTPKGTAVCDISLAINRMLPPEQEGGERREETTYVDVTLWGKTAELAQQYLTKAVSRNKVISSAVCEGGFHSSNRRGICHAAA
jgi:single-strand DNA-binding protein